MIVVHDRDAQSLRRCLEYQLARIEMVDCRRLERGEIVRPFPGVKAVGQVVVDHERLAGQLLGARLRADALAQRFRHYGVDPVAVELHRVQRRVRPFHQSDCGIQRIAHAQFRMRARIDIDVQAGMQLAQFG